MIQERRVLITGARRGIGFDVATRLLEHGHTVYATVHREESVEPTREALNVHGWRWVVEKLDLLDHNDIARAALWDVDVLVNNAAVSEGGPLLDIGLDHAQRVFQTNALGTLALIQAVVPGMVARKRVGSRVLIVGSIMGVIPTPWRAAYGMSKWALECMAHSLRAELDPLGIAVVMVNPGAYKTGFNDESADRAWERVSATSPYWPSDYEGMRTADELTARVEVKETAAIATQIVAAVEATSPKDRYVAPWWQWIGRPR